MASTLKRRRTMLISTLILLLTAVVYTVMRYDSYSSGELSIIAIMVLVSSALLSEVAALRQRLKRLEKRDP
ncbi:hypothetical protein FCL40_09570 [Ferrimonas sediminicola]|uniref:Uncharacterized protein n=1 Tax=Ferrimonas sediminicola TaxID=2569538 RepID=A0A4U1BFT8_9GAMM|nr:hypothetical protein [Ferrimonas sediminicola]TKB48881.1 hypothetical protein FCL40_09570 [Ferrimonas sediminicola]